MRVCVDLAVTGAVLEYLLEVADPEYLDAQRLTESGNKALAVYDGQALLFACCYRFVQQPHGRELEIVAVNGTRAKAVQWVKSALPVVKELADKGGANRILIPVERAAMQKLLEMLNFSPLTTFMSMGLR